MLLYIAGNYLVTLDMRQSPPTRSYVKGVDGRGIGAFVCHPKLPLVVVGEKGNDPNLYVYEYPSWRVVNVLRKGAERGYSCLAFNADGSKLATVAMGQCPFPLESAPPPPPVNATFVSCNQDRTIF